ncbi:hypothetical protein [Amycolatopsis sp. NPDC057786]|uniref:hypothetical protein n=1 Tax=Amycolatopsis sp. NPDC057786 TaxID=3346250 RepID=UPI00366AD8ED
MDLTAGGARAVSVARSERNGLIPAGTVLAGSVISLIGLTWDIQWHGDVGPDTFFTMPHLFLYSGSAISGLASLVVVLMTTAARRAGRPIDARVGGRAINVFGKVFAAPAGYLVTGTGAAMFLLYGLWDQWWHGLYGFDAVIDSPPHIGLLLSITLSIIGTVMVFAAAREHRWGTVGVVGSLGVLIAFSTVTVLGLQQIDVDGLDVVSVGIALLSVLLVSAGAGFRARPGGAVRVAAALAVIQAITWWFSPWAAEAYAGAVGLPMRDYIDGVPAMPSMMPMALLPIAAVLEAVYLLSRRGWSAGRVSLLAGGIGGLLVGASMPIQNAIVYGADSIRWPIVFTTAAAGAVVGLLGGFAGWRFGGMLGLLAPAKGEHTHA